MRRNLCHRRVRGCLRHRRNAATDIGVICRRVRWWRVGQNVLQHWLRDEAEILLSASETSRNIVNRDRALRLGKQRRERTVRRAVVLLRQRRCAALGLLLLLLELSREEL